MKIGKKRIFLTLFVCVLFSVLISCGIPRMFPWRRGSQFEMDGSHLQFFLSFHVDNDTPEGDNITLVPRLDTPVLRFYYLVVPNTSAQASNLTTVDRIITSFGSRYSSSIPKTFGSGEAAYTTSYTYDTATSDSIAVSLYELSIVTLDDNGNMVRYEPSSAYFEGIGFFSAVGESGTDTETPPYSEGTPSEQSDPEGGDGTSDSPSDAPTGEFAREYEATYSFSPVPANEGGYYVQLILNGDENHPYYLARSNGEPFTIRTDDYINTRSGQHREFLLEDKDEVTQPQIRIYTAASFTFEGYTTRATVTTDSTTSSGYQLLGIF